jgi:hypothetical protein
VLDRQSCEAWRTRELAVPLSTALNFAPEGLVLGAGTVLLGAKGPRWLQNVAGQETRVLALLSAAYGRAVAPSVLGNIARAAKAWEQGEDCLAYIHLAHARLGELQKPHVAARRLVVVDAHLNVGGSPRIVFEALKVGCSYIAALEKYNPNEPRVPAGSGRTSGEWTDGDRAGTDASAGEHAPEEQPQGSSLLSKPPPPATSFLGELDVAQVAELAAYAARILGPVGAAAAAFGLLFIPSPNDLHVEGEVSGVAGLRYSWNRDEALLHFTYDAADGEQRTFAAYIDGDKFRDEQGGVIGRVLSDGGILIESAVASPDLVKDDEPRLCPIPGPDKPNEAEHTRTM